MDTHRLRPLVEAVVWPLLFFTTCDEDTLDPDLALQQVESMAAVLEPLDPALKALVVKVIQEMAQEEPRLDVQAQLYGLPQGLGWLDEPVGETPAQG